MNNTHTLLNDIANLIYNILPEVLSKRYDITWKSDGSPVTLADIFIENKIAAFLEEKIPGIVFIGEETFQGQMIIDNGWIAVLDPIDGTENFCSGLKEWGVSLSIWNKGQHVASMLMLPELSELMITGDIPLVPHSRIIGYSSSCHPEIAQGVALNQESRIMGCAVYNLFNVIRGAYQRFVNPKGAYSWDLLAGVALAHEAGCIIQIDGEKYHGQFLEPYKRYRVDIQHQYDFHSRKGSVSR